MTPRRWALPLLFAVAVVASCGATTPPTDSGGLRMFDEGGLTFAYPDAWQEFHHPVVSSFSMSIADLATVDVPEPCISRPVAVVTETVCADRFRLDPNTLVVHVVTNGFPGFDIVQSRPPEATAITVGGRPGFVVQRPPDDPSTLADTVISWTLSRPEAIGNFYTIDAVMRGPDLGRLEDQLRQMMAGLRFTQP
jgi:hypothetical protein